VLSPRPVAAAETLQVPAQFDTIQEAIDVDETVGPATTIMGFTIQNAYVGAAPNLGALSAPAVPALESPFPLVLVLLASGAMLLAANGRLVKPGGRIRRPNGDPESNQR
jgi:hypothetical protein